MPAKPKILVADDEQDIRDLLHDLLNKEYQVVEAKNGEIALTLLRKESFNLALLDIMMPKMDGYKVAQQIKEQNINAPFIFLSAKGEYNDRIRGLELGADDYITKPFTNKELQLRIKRKLYIQKKIELRNKRLQLMNHNIITPTGVIQGSLQIQMELLNKMKETFLSTNCGKNSYLISKADIEKVEKNFQESIQLMYESTEQLVKISRNLTAIFGELNAQLSKTAQPLDQFIFDTISLLKPKKLKCHINHPIPNITLNCDVEKIRSVFFELLDNIILHNDNRIPTADIHIKKEDQTIIISITDNGRGIKSTDFQNAFEEFWSTYEEINHTRGQGIGLWICKKYLNIHNGHIWFEKSEIGKGSTICFSLPIS